MTQEDKELLLKDLCARSPYGVKSKSQASHLEINTIDGYFVDGDGRKMFHLSEPDFWQEVDCFQYYLRPMSSMTEEEKKELREIAVSLLYNKDDVMVGAQINSFQQLNDVLKLFNSHHLDYNGLIEKGLALEAPKDMYNI